MARDGTPTDDGRGLIELVTQVSKAFHRRSTEEMLGMRWKEFLVLSYLHEHPGTTQQELGEVMLVDSNTVVLLLNELEARGFSIRRRDTGDRRRHVVEITPSGRDAVARGEKAREAIEDEVFAALTADERRTLRWLLVRTLEGQARVFPVPSART
jgi:DNA-binding MarR family transcriptional regulator